MNIRNYIDPESIFVITAFDLTGKPLMAFKRRSRKNHEKE